MGGFLLKKEEKELIENLKSILDENEFEVMLWELGLCNRPQPNNDGQLLENILKYTKISIYKVEGLRNSALKKIKENMENIF